MLSGLSVLRVINDNYGVPKVVAAFTVCSE